MKHIESVFVFIFFIFIVLIDVAANSGPFKAVLLSVEPCERTRNQVEDAPFVINLEMYNKTSKINLLRGNVTVTREYRIKGTRIKNAIWSNNQWKVLRVINTVACNGVIFPLAAMMVGVKYNRKNCLLSKGVYPFNDLDIDKAQHAWMKDQEYGKHRWIMEAFTNNGTAICMNSISIVKPPD